MAADVDIRLGGGGGAGIRCRVSVLMAVYNAAAYVREAIESVLAQTLRDFELVVVDDGSTDGSGKVIAELAEQDGRLLTHRQENRGIGAASNEALWGARGEYVAILDSDDVMLPDRLAVQADYLDKHPGIAAVGSQWYVMDAAGRTLGVDRHATDPEALRALMFGYFSMHHPTIMARREAMIACGGYETAVRRGCMDYGMFMKMLLAGYRVANTPNVLTCWRLTPGGATLGGGLAQTEDCARIRARGFQTLSDTSPQQADEVAVSLVRTFPAGSWFDEKVGRVVPNAEPSPALARWHCLAADGRLPALEVLSVAWLEKEAGHARDLPAALRRAGRAWLATLVEMKAGQEIDGPARLELSEQDAGLVVHSLSSKPGTACSLSVLVPSGGDPSVAERIDSLLMGLPTDGEVVVFPAEPRATLEAAGIRDARVRVLDGERDGRSFWATALNTANGRYLAFLEPGYRYHPDFLAEASSVLDASKEVALTYALSNVYYADALDAEGNLVSDPAPEPRWTREVLLGKARFRLSGMVFRRGALADVPRGVLEAGELAAWALARWLLVRNRPRFLNVRNDEVMPAVGLGNNIAIALGQRLVGWYFDTGRGSIPSEYVWAGLSPAQGRERLRRLDAQFAQGNLCVHPGNLAILLTFILRFAPAPLVSATFRDVLRKYASSAFPALRERGRLATWLGVAWTTADSVRHKVIPVKQPMGSVLKP